MSFINSEFSNMKTNTKAAVLFGFVVKSELKCILSYFLLAKPFPVLVVGVNDYLFITLDRLKGRKLCSFSQRNHGHMTSAFWPKLIKAELQMGSVGQPQAETMGLPGLSGV